MLLGLLAALLATAIFADGLLSGPKDSKKASIVTPPVERALPKVFARSVPKHHGVTFAIGRPAPGGRGGPENPGDYIPEDGPRHGWFVPGDQQPIDGFASSPVSLPTQTGYFTAPVGRFSGFPGGIGGGGGDGSIRITSDKKTDPDSGTDEPEASTNDPVPATDNLGKVVNESTGDTPPQDIVIVDPGDQPDPPFQPVTVTGASSPGTVVSITGSPGQPGNPGTTDTQTSGGGASAPTTLVPIAAIPEPQSWAMMIAGFLTLGLALRRPRRRMQRETVSVAG